MSPVIGHVIVGPARHGVVGYAERIRSALDQRFPGHHPLTQFSPTEPRLDGIHVHFSDRLFGSTPGAAADRFCAAAATLDSRVSVTLHDLPQPSDGSGAARRVDAYRRVAQCARGVVVSSNHERHLLADISDTPAAHVIPLAVRMPARSGISCAVARNDVAVFGYLYPGKGHEEVLRALQFLDSAVGFVAIGEPSTGHQDLVPTLSSIAAHLNRRFDVTGYVGDDDLRSLLESVAVPIAHHRHMSASGSIVTWIESGRRPLVPASRYTEEIAARSPGVVQIYPDTPRGLVDALSAALDDPASTWVAPDVTARPRLGEVADDHARLFEQWFA